MESRLSYAQQVLELEKIVRLEERQPQETFERRSLAGVEPGATCLVCGRAPAQTCAWCRGVSYCGVEHQAVDGPWHGEVCEVLREQAADAELRGALPRLIERWLARDDGASSSSGLTGWASYLGENVATAEQRLLTDAASRPQTLAYLLRTLELPTQPKKQGLVRIHVMAASVKEVEALAMYAELATLVRPNAVDVTFVGPELTLPPTIASRAGAVTFGFHRGEYRRALWPRLGVPDLIVGFDAGLLLYPSWQGTLVDLIGSAVPYAITSYRVWEAAAEARLLAQAGASCVRPVAVNPFASRAARRSTTIGNDVSWDNSYVSIWR